MSCSAPHDVVQLNSSCKFWQCIPLAILPLFQKSVQVYSQETNSISMSSCCIYSNSTFSIPLTLAYSMWIPQLPDDFQDIYVQKFGDASSAEVYTYCKQELIQEVWRLLLDGKFMEAYEHGIVIKCSDGIKHHFFLSRIQWITLRSKCTCLTQVHCLVPWCIPDRIMLACIKFLGECPCPWCLVVKKDIPKMGTRSDFEQQEQTAWVDNKTCHMKVEQARAFIFWKGAGVNSSWVWNLLNDKSLTPNHVSNIPIRYL